MTDRDPSEHPGTDAPEVPVRLTPELVGRPWGGGRFGSVGGLPVGEAWVSGEGATIPDGRTLAETGLASRLPLVKLLDVHGALSVQVHPDDTTARALRGPGALGKHECWVVLEAPNEATIHLGLTTPTAVEDLFSADERRVVGALRARRVAPGSVVDIPPGTVHAPDGELLLFEVQQRSDLTFRIWDWGRSRPVHPKEARRAIRPDADPRIGVLPTTFGRSLVSRPGAPFRLESCRSGSDGESIEVGLDRPGVLSITRGSLLLRSATGSRQGPGKGARERLEAGSRERLEAGSHWLVPPGRWTLEGRGEALLATT